MSGGTSVVGHAGALISPRIDFSAEVAPLALTFKTWWEIEAVNPNEYGFDLMSVDYQIEGDDSWITFVRLNPLTDPKGYENLASLPYSNAGFNVAPFWIEQAPISLNRLAGKVFKLRFTFSTEDELFNGFRGWLLDDVKISQREGTFPLWDEVDRILLGDNGPANVETSLSDVTNLTEFAVSLTVRSQNAISAQLRLYDQNGEPLSVAFGRTALIKGEAQDINIVGIIAAPEVEYRVVVELVDANGQIWANADLTFPFADDFPEEGLGPI